MPSARRSSSDGEAGRVSDWTFTPACWHWASKELMKLIAWLPSICLPGATTNPDWSIRLGSLAAPGKEALVAATTPLAPTTYKLPPLLKLKVGAAIFSLIVGFCEKSDKSILTLSISGYWRLSESAMPRLSRVSLVLLRRAVKSSLAAPVYSSVE